MWAFRQWRSAANVRGRPLFVGLMLFSTLVIVVRLAEAFGAPGS